MKKIISFQIALTALTYTGFAAASDLARQTSSLLQSYRTAAHLQSMQLDRLSSLMDEMWRETQKLKETKAYTSQSGAIHNRLGELSGRIRETAASFHSHGFRVTMDASKMADVVELRRNHYLRNVDRLAAMDAKGFSTLNLPKDVVRDVSVMREIRHLPLVERNQLWNQYEGRTFGERVDMRNEARVKEQIAGIKTKGGSVRLNTYHTSVDVSLTHGNFIRMQTPDGAIVQGKVIGVLPNGKVLIENVFGQLIKGLTAGLEGARIIDLAKARELKVYGSESQAARGAADLELSVRLGRRDLVQAIKRDELTLLAQRKPTKGGYLDRRVVGPAVIDKRMGEQIIQNHIGTAVGIIF